MLILGEKYKFTTLELKYLHKRFNKINKISYKDESAKVVIDKIKEILDRDRFTVVVLNTKAKVDNKIIKFLTNLKFDSRYKDIRLIGIEHFLEEYLQKCYIPDDNSDLHYLDSIKGYTTFQKVQKKFIDIIGVIILFPVSLVVYFITKHKIKKESKGDVFFRQNRVGLNNKKFKCIKFRTMHNVDSSDKFVKKDDDRVFGWGKVMRKSRLDELPQILNIIKNEMHLIGPRAEWDKLVEEYENEIPYYNQRHIVIPGITGWAQVMFVEGKFKEDTKQKLMYDLYYIKHWSLLLELKVIIRTARVVFGGRGV